MSQDETVEAKTKYFCMDFVFSSHLTSEATKNIHFDQRYEIVRRKSMLILHMKKFTAAFTNLTILSLQAYFSLSTHKILNHELSLTRYTLCTT